MNEEELREFVTGVIEEAKLGLFDTQIYVNDIMAGFAMAYGGEEE